MGYQTTHTLTIEKGFTEEIGKKLDELLEKADLLYIFDDRDCDTYYPSDSWKWYEHTSDMKKISEELGNDVLLLLEGEGEENNDVWKEYYRNGKCALYRPKVVWEDFKEEDLK